MDDSTLLGGMRRTRGAAAGVCYSAFSTSIGSIRAARLAGKSVAIAATTALALGMFLALASLRSAQKSHTAFLILVPLFALGYPIFDTLLAVGLILFLL